MGKALFSQIFDTAVSHNISEIFGGTVIEKCSLDTEERALNAVLRAEKYIAAESRNELVNQLKNALKLNECHISCIFSEDALIPAACADIAAELKVKNAALNGYFNGAEFKLNDNNVNITLKYGGYDTITDCGWENAFKRIIKDRFGRDITVSFDGQLEKVEIELPPAEPPKPAEKAERQAAPQKQSAPARPAAPKKEIKFEKREGRPDNGIVYLDNPQQFYGRGGISNHTRDMISITGDDTEIACWGEVFGLETRDIKTKRGTDMTIVNFSFSDHTNSLNASLFIDTHRMGDIAPLKDGAFILVNGSYEFDNYKKDFVVKPRAMALLQKYTEKDEHEGEKRVELHCHTNMSAKDAVSSADAIVKQAYEWGHKAIAITDHGVVQAYPAAAGAVKAIRKAGGDFKVIYGVESYFVDDVNNDVKDLNAKQTAKYRYHQIILVKNLTGLKNLYKLVSEAHLHDFRGKPLTMRSKLDKLREGLILGSACEQGELYRAIIDEKPEEELLRIADYYDYLEIQPLGNNAFMVRESSYPDKKDKKTGEVIPNRFKKVTDFEVIKNFNRKVVELADKLGKPVVATGDVHFLKKSDDIIRKILMAGQGFDDFDNQAPLYLKTTDEMLADFDYFGERAREFVIDNPNKIADMVDGDVIPVPDGNYPPVIEGSDELLHDICWDTAHKTYGENLPEVVEKRLEKELNSIINNGFSIMYISAQKLVAYSEENGYLVGSRGSVGSSFAATMAGISEVNPLPPHYVCPECRYSEFFLHGEVGSGFDLPEKKCPECGAQLNRNGHDIPFETFLGFKGDKVPDIDLNFSDEFQNSVQKYTETLFGSENVFKAGTISTVAEKTAYGFAKAYAEKKGITLSNAELNRLASLVEKAQIKQTTGQHPAGMIIVPKTNTIYDFCPIQHPADDVNSDIITTHFDFHSIHDTILKLDELGHVVPTTYKYLEEYTGIPVNDVSMSDSEVYSLFTSTKALGVEPEEIDSRTGTYCLPEFGTKFVREMLIDCQPKNFSDLLQISGLSHGTDVWLGNAKDLIDNGTCTISEVIGTRDNIMVYLIHKGLEEGRAFKITETVRKGLVAKGKVSAEDWSAMEDDMRSHGVPEWYIESCHKIKYMFPKAHAAAYVISALRLAWYKVHRPLEFYCAYFTARPEDVDVPTIMNGKQAVRQYLQNIKAKGKEASKKELDVYNNMLIFNEMMSRGIEVLPIDIKHSHAMKYLPENGKMRLPFGALSGVGEKAAYSIYEAAQKGDFVSREDFQIEAGVSKTIIQNLADLGAMNDLPDTNQISMF
ncbi:MAG TPA: PolC-type DNA polymerase III [Ruminococcaceae bacterium]|nr:PolC-type DNA polymerase III [Oscillospiraceae bacterium]